MSKLHSTSQDVYARAILQALLAAGGVLDSPDIHEKVWVIVPVKKDDTGVLSTGHIRRETDVAWTITSLKHQGFVVHVKRGTWRITDAGHKYLSQTGRTQ